MSSERQPSEPQPIRNHLGSFLLQRIFAPSRERRAAAAAAAAEIATATERFRAAAEERRRERIAPHLEACGVDRETTAVFRSAETLKATAALLAVRDWLSGKLGDRPFLVLATGGGYGAGKTVAAAYCLLRAVRQVQAMAHPLADEPVTVEELDARRGMFISAAQLRFASRFADGRETPIPDRAATVEWLVLDELREEDGKGAGRARLEEVLAERYARGLKTVITSNLRQEELRAVLGERLASRLAEGAVVADPGQIDLRRQRAGGAR